MDRNNPFAQIEREFDQMKAEIERKDALLACATKRLRDMAAFPFMLRASCCPAMRVPCDGRIAPDIRPENYPKLRLNDCSWAEIASYAEAGLAPFYFRVGDAKTITLKDGTSLDVRIIGFDHDTHQSGCGKLPITFETVQTLNEDYVMNDEWTNKGGWRDSKLRRVLNSDIFDLLPDDLKAVIKPCVKWTGLGGGKDEIGTVEDKLFVLSEQEVFGRKVYSMGGEGRWYEWYRQEDNEYGKCKQSGERDWRWTRSPRSGGDTSNFCRVYSNGDANYGNASDSYGVSFGFCV